MLRVALHVRSARDMAEDIRVRRGAVHEPERDAGVRGMDERALSLDEEEVSPTLCPLDDEVRTGLTPPMRWCSWPS